MIENRMLRNFLAVVDEGSFVRAAEVVRMTQSGLTQSIAKLEQLLSVSLFDRGRFGAVPTEAGYLLAQRARLILAELGNAVNELGALRDGTSGRVAIGIGAGIVGREIADGLEAFLRRKHDVLLSFSEGASPDLLPRLAVGELDAVLCQPDPATPISIEFKAETVALHNERVLVGRTHLLAGSKTATLEQLSDQVWCIPPTGNRRLEHIRGVFANVALSAPTKIIRTNSIKLGFELVRRGLAIVVANPNSVLRDLVEGHIISLRCAPLEEERKTLLVMRARPHGSSALRALLSDLKFALQSNSSSAL